MKASQGRDWSVFYPQRPRIADMGIDCGFHAKAPCDFHANIEKAKNSLGKWPDDVLPRNLRVVHGDDRFPDPFTGESR